MNNSNNKESFLNSIRLMPKEDKKLLNIQENVENENIDLSTLSNEDLDRLNSLYDKQIESLNKILIAKEQELKSITSNKKTNI